MISNLIYIIGISIAEFMFAHRLHRRKLFVLRFILGLAVSITIAILLPTYYNAWYVSAIYVLLFSVRLVSMKRTYNEPRINLLFCGLAAYTTQHLAYQFATLVTMFIGFGQESMFGIYYTSVIDFSTLNIETFFWFLVYAICYFTVYIVVYQLYAKKIEKGATLKIENRSLLILVAVCIVVQIVLNSLTVYSREEQTTLNSVIRCIYVCFFCFVLLQWQFNLLYTRRVKSDLEFTLKIITKEKEQYRFMKENIEFLNVKYHDLKHQIYNIKKNNGFDMEELNKIESAISVYNSLTNTGCEALDVILTEKSFYCIKNNIELSCLADGKCLSFMKETDIYSLFGNAIDNAIEAVIELSDSEKRIIVLKINASEKFTVINIHNYFAHDIRFDEKTRLPKTSKQNKRIHGYGMKSIRYIVEKYSGTLSVRTEGDMFMLDILFPWNSERS